MRLKNRSTSGTLLYVTRVFHSYVYSKECGCSFVMSITTHVNRSIFTELCKDIMRLDPTLSWGVLISCIEHFHHGDSASIWSKKTLVPLNEVFKFVKYT
jgi:hypothetical protein